MIHPFFYFILSFGREVGKKRFKIKLRIRVRLKFLSVTSKEVQATSIVK